MNFVLKQEVKTKIKLKTMEYDNTISVVDCL